MVIKVNPVIDNQTRVMCQMPFHGHPNGCPNYGKKKGCPPGAPLFHEVFDLSQPVYAIINVIDLKANANEMKINNLDCSEQQLKSIQYWHGAAKKGLKEKIVKFLREHQGYYVTTCPEAMGVNITKTLENAGFKLEWPPVNFACQVALAGFKKAQLKY